MLLKNSPLFRGKIRKSKERAIKVGRYLKYGDKVAGHSEASNTMYRISRDLWLSMACGSFDPALIGPYHFLHRNYEVTPRFPPHPAAFIPIGAIWGFTKHGRSIAGAD